MGLTSEQYERIQKFCEGEMDPEEQEVFLKELATDSQMQNYLDLELAIIQDLSGPDQSLYGEAGQRDKNQFDDPQFIKSLTRKAEADRPSKKTHIINLWPYMAAAASILVVVSIILWQNSNSSTTIANIKKDSSLKQTDSIPRRGNNDSAEFIQQQKPVFNYATLYKEFYRKDEVPSEIPELLADAFLDYQDDDYRKLQGFNLENLPRSRGEPANDENSSQAIRELGHYYKAITFIETSKDKQAISNLNWVLKNSRNKFLKGKAQWYLALIHLKAGNKNAAVPLFQAVAANKNLKPYNSRATNLLTKLL